MRALILILLVACTPVTRDAPNVPQQDTVRPLVTDQLPYKLEREKVRAWHAANNWCLRRVWPSTDEFVVCSWNYQNLRTPPMYSMTAYDSENRSTKYATFTPVPCRMYGKCDHMFRTTYASEHEFVDHFNGLYPDLAARGRAEEMADSADRVLPSMQQKMFDALKSELGRRFGAPGWAAPHDFGATWETATSVIGLFVAGNGGWVVETHEMRS